MHQFLLIVVLSTAVPTPIYDGGAAHYHPGIMEQVAANRSMPVVSCMVASPYFRLGQWVKVVRRKTGESRSCRVTDYPHPKDRPHIVRRGIVVELDFKSAKALCGIRRYAEQPPRACQVRIWPLRPAGRPAMLFPKSKQEHDR